MKLEQWLKLAGMTQHHLSHLVGCSGATINRHLKHGRVLDPDVVVRIYFVTLGAVRPDDFYDLERMPPEIEALFKTNWAERMRAPLGGIAASIPRQDNPPGAV